MGGSPIPNIQSPISDLESSQVMDDKQEILASTSIQQLDHPILYNSEPATFLAITSNDHLLEFSTHFINTVVENIGLDADSSVALVDNTIYVVGGFEDGIPSSKVVFYDNFHPAQSDSNYFPLIKKQAPSLNSPKAIPTLIVLGSKLFAFSNEFYHVTPRRKTSSLFLESPPICEFLDTSRPQNKWKWCPLSSFPILPSPISINLFSYSIASFSVQPNNHTLFLSFGLSGTCGHYSISYNDSTSLWTQLQPIPLPFLGEGKFLDDICFGFPSGMDRHDRDYIASYKFSVDCKTFTWVALATFSLDSSLAPLHSYPSIRSFFPITKNILATVCARPLPKLVNVPDGSDVEWEVHVLSPAELKRMEIKGRRKEFKDLHSSRASWTFFRSINLNVQAIVGAFW